MNRLKTSIITLSLLIVTTIANAENTNRYQVMYGSKQISGENIIFEKPEPQIVEECNIPNSTWMAGSSAYQLMTITFNGVYLYEGGDYLATEKVVNGYKYKRTGTIGNYGSYQTYNVCRVKI